MWQDFLTTTLLSRIRCRNVDAYVLVKGSCSRIVHFFSNAGEETISRQPLFVELVISYSWCRRIGKHLGTFNGFPSYPHYHQHWLLFFTFSRFGVAPIKVSDDCSLCYHHITWLFLLPHSSTVLVMLVMYALWFSIWNSTLLLVRMFSYKWQLLLSDCGDDLSFILITLVNMVLNRNVRLWMKIT